MCVYSPPNASEQVPADVGLMDRWSSSSWQSMQVRRTGVSCPKVHVVWCLLSAVPTGSRFLSLPGLRRKEGRDDLSKAVKDEGERERCKTFIKSLCFHHPGSVLGIK